MSNTVAAWMAGIILAAATVDYLLNGGQVVFFLWLKLVDLMNWVAFWR